MNNSVSINLRNEEYDQLLKALEISTAEKIVTSDKRVENAKKRTKNCLAFIHEIREVFYEDFGDIFLKREIKEIDKKKLDDLLDKYSNLLGLA